MEAGQTVYEGWVYGVGEWQYSKVSKLLRSAFETVEYKYLKDDTGTIYMRGPSPMFEEDEENKLATFDLLADQIIERGKGRLLATTWDERGTVALTVYDFGSKTWSSREVDLG